MLFQYVKNNSQFSFLWYIWHYVSCSEIWRKITYCIDTAKWRSHIIT